MAWRLLVFLIIGSMHSQQNENGGVMRNLNLLFVLVFLTACSSVDYYDNGDVAHISSANDSIVLQPVGTEPIELKTVNGEISVGKGYSLNDVKTVNGEIHLGPEIVAKHVRTVNGDIDLERGSVVDSLSAVNGNVRVNNSKVVGDTRTVNGRIQTRDNTHIGGSVTTSNGRIALVDTIVERDVAMSDGKINLNNTVVKGNIIVREKRFWDFLDFDIFPPKVIIGPNSIVEGDIIVRRKAKLFVHESAKIASVEGVQAEYFSGDRP